LLVAHDGTPATCAEAAGLVDGAAGDPGADDPEAVAEEAGADGDPDEPALAAGGELLAQAAASSTVAPRTANPAIRRVIAPPTVTIHCGHLTPYDGDAAIAVGSSTDFTGCNRYSLPTATA
jgi:hypothetical protein